MSLCLCVELFVVPRAQAQGAAPQSRLEQAAAAIAADRLGEAEQQLNAILKAAPGDVLALNLLGTVRAKQNRLDEAEALFLRAVRADRRFVGAHMNLAYLYLLRGAPEKTAADAEGSLAARPCSTPTPSTSSRGLSARSRRALRSASVSSRASDARGV